MDGWGKGGQQQAQQQIYRSKKIVHFVFACENSYRSKYYKYRWKHLTFNFTNHVQRRMKKKSAVQTHTQTHTRVQICIRNDARNDEMNNDDWETEEKNQHENATIYMLVHIRIRCMYRWMLHRIQNRDAIFGLFGVCACNGELV